MSIALDLALIVRDSLNNFGLSVANLGVAYTLAFRVGSNSCTWISQIELAKEVNLDERNLRNHCKKLQEVGVILIEKDTKDPRRNRYSFNPIIANYHAMKDHQKLKCRTILSGTFEDTGRNHPVSTGRNHPVLLTPEIAASPVVEPKNEGASFPKAKEERNIKSKGTLSCASDDARNSFAEFCSVYPKKKWRADAERAWHKHKLHPMVTEIIASLRLQIANDAQWQSPQYIPMPATYLNGERWKDEIIKQGRPNNGQRESAAQTCSRLTLESLQNDLANERKQTARTTHATNELDYNPISAFPRHMAG